MDSRVTMPNTREKEKLIELLSQVQYLGGLEEKVADHLIANSVTLKSHDCHWATEQAYKNGYEKGKADAMKWISVKDRLPEEDGKYFVFRKHTYGAGITTLRFAKDARKVDKYDFHRGWKKVWYEYDSEWGHYTLDDVTHWMPLPEAPKGE